MFVSLLTDCANGGFREGKPEYYQQFNSVDELVNSLKFFWSEKERENEELPEPTTEKIILPKLANFKILVQGDQEAEEFLKNNKPVQGDFFKDLMEKSEARRQERQEKQKESMRIKKLELIEEIKKAPLDRLTKTSFSQNLSCCIFWIYKSDEKDIWLTKEDLS